jgi:hypothetical protein
MNPDIVKILLSSDGNRRLLIIKRSDGAFHNIEEYWHKSVYEGELIAVGWASLGTDGSLYQTVEIVEREGRINYKWLASDSD